MLPIAQLTSAKTPEQAADVVRSWTQPVNPDELDPQDRFITRRELLAILDGDLPEWAEAQPQDQADQTPAGQDGKPDQPETTTQDRADAQAGSVPATADAQPTPKRKGK